MRRYKNHHDDRHDKFLGLRLPGQLLASLDHAAAAGLMDRSGLAREILRQHLAQNEPVVMRRGETLPQLSEAVDAIEKAIPQTRAIGNLLNQGMRRFHATGKLDVVPGLCAACDRYLIVSQAEQAALSHLLRL